LRSGLLSVLHDLPLALDVVGYHFRFLAGGISDFEVEGFDPTGRVQGEGWCRRVGESDRIAEDRIFTGHVLGGPAFEGTGCLFAI
jgi:hypothetical protein